MKDLDGILGIESLKVRYPCLMVIAVETYHKIDHGLRLDMRSRFELGTSVKLLKDVIRCDIILIDQAAKPETTLLKLRYSLSDRIPHKIRHSHLSCIHCIDCQ